MDYCNDHAFNSYYASVIQGSPPASLASPAGYYEGVSPEAANHTGGYFRESVAHDISFEREETTAPAAVSNSGGGRNKKRRQKRDPSKPKGWISSVLMYSNANRERAKADNPDATFGDIARLLSAEYKNLSSEHTAFWQNAAKNDRARYDLEMESYVPPAAQISGGDASRAVVVMPVSLAQDDIFVESKITIKKQKKKTKDPNAPKRNLTAWQIFSTGNSRKQILAQYPGSTSKDMMQILGSQFRALTDEERAPFDKLARAERERFERETAVYMEIPVMQASDRVIY